MLDSPADKPLYFKAEADGFVRVVAGVVLVSLLTAIPLFLWAQEVALWQRALVAGLFAILSITLIDKLFFTVYELNAEGLSVHTQLRHAHFPYRKMRAIKQVGVRGLVTSRNHKRFSLGRKSIMITIDDPIWKTISVSPAYADVFVDRLLTAIDAERSRRATVSVPQKKRNHRES